jgi:hypothetical protein
VNEQELAVVRSMTEVEPIITVADFIFDDYTLCFGFSKDPTTTWHIYLKDGLIHRLLYNHEREVVEYESAESFPCARLNPRKRSYSESTNYAFALFMAKSGHPLCFTTHDPERDVARRAGIMGQKPANQFAGLILEDLT